jgi:hypothetical protein
MSEREEQLRRDAAALADAVDRELEIVFRPVSEHAERVGEMAQELTLLADRTVQRAQALKSADDGRDPAAVSELTAMAEILRSLSSELHILTQRSVQDLYHVKTRLVRTVRATALGNRRRYERVDVDVPAEASFSGRREPARVVNLSLGGAKMDLAINREIGTLVALKVAGLTHELKGEVVKVDEAGTQLRFIIGDDAADELRRFLERAGSARPRQSD